MPKGKIDMERKWIKRYGECMHTEILSIIEESDIPKGCYYLAGYTNRYDSGIITEHSWSTEEFKYLLELRIFCGKQELLFLRSSIGAKLQWRLTDDESLDDTDYIDSEQYIDINVEKSLGSMAKDRQDVVQLFTTVGGSYYLPLKEGENAVAVRAYIAYDDNGMAYVADHRLCGFVEK